MRPPPNLASTRVKTRRGGWHSDARYEDVRDVGFFLVVAGWIVVVFANGGRIKGSLMIILGADILIAGLLAKQMPKTD